MSLSVTSCHPDPPFNIGNNFSQTVTVYFDGHKMGQIRSKMTKIFYPGDVSTQNGQLNPSGLLFELKTDSGEILFSRHYSRDELIKIIPAHLEPYWIGPDTK